MQVFGQVRVEMLLKGTQRHPQHRVTFEDTPWDMAWENAVTVVGARQCFKHPSGAAMQREHYQSIKFFSRLGAAPAAIYDKKKGRHW